MKPTMIIDHVSRKINDKFSAYIHHTSTAADTDCRNWIGSTLHKVVLHSDGLARDVILSRYYVREIFGYPASRLMPGRNESVTGTLSIQDGCLKFRSARLNNRHAVSLSFGIGCNAETGSFSVTCRDPMARAKPILVGVLSSA
jgi:hypothetical protein